jgi:hypothetical protein
MKATLMLAMLCLATAFAITALTIRMAPSAPTGITSWTSLGKIWNLYSEIEPMGDPIDGPGLPH